MERSKYTVKTNLHSHLDAKDTSYDKGRLHEGLHSIVSAYTDSTGKFITDRFIDKLLHSKHPKNLTERLHETQSTPAFPKHSFRWGDGTKNDQPSDTVIANKEEGICMHKLKISDSKYPDYESLPEKVLNESFGKTISLDVFESELQKYLLETGHAPHYCAYMTSLCSTGPGAVKLFDPKKHRTFNNRRAPFALGGLGGIPFVGISGMSAMTAQLPPGGKVVLVYGQHVGIDELGRIGFSTLKDKPSGSIVRVQSCEPIMKVYKSLLNLNDSDFLLDAGKEELNSDYLGLKKIVEPHMEKLELKSERPILNLPAIMYAEQRKRLYEIANASIEGKGIMVGYIRIIMPPGQDDRIILKNVDIVKPKNLRKQYDEETKEESDSELWLVDKLDLLRSRCIKAECSIITKREVKNAIKSTVENLEDRQRAKRSATRAKQAHDARLADDWKLDEHGKTPIVLQKLRGLAIYFRWSRMVRRLFNVVRLKEVDEDWDLNSNTRADAKVKFGKLFMVMRWKGLMNRLLTKHNRLERKELMRYY